jgi:hypothetical protein
MPVLATWSPRDALLDAIVPLGLACSAGTALVVDLDPTGPRWPGSFTLADLVRRGPTRDELVPARRGPAVLANGGIEADEAAEVVSALTDGWPAVVIRCPPGFPCPEGAIAILPLLPEPFVLSAEPPVVYQRSHLSPRIEQQPHILPPPSRRTVAALLSSRQPVRSDRWIRALRNVWDLA